MHKSKKQKLSPAVEGLVKQCQAALKALKKSHLSPPFSEPVDWKALNLPMYPKIIKHPMDLGTVEKKLLAGKYSSIADFTADVNLVWENAQLFNTEGSEIYDAATELRELFETQMSGVPDGPLNGSSGGGSSGASLSAEELSQCKAVLREIRKKDIADPFLTPVDWKTLGIPDYPTVIKRPMDLGTVSNQLDAGKYSSVKQVAADVDLVWTNAMTYNIDGSWIYQSASKLKQFADQKFAPILSSGGAQEETADQPTELTFEMKAQLNHNANLLSSKELYGMVGIVEVRLLIRSAPYITPWASKQMRLRPPNLIAGVRPNPLLLT
eukprot:scaffold189393_cov35-Tisochrysis_lutea.AAC.1